MPVNFPTLPPFPLSDTSPSLALMAPEDAVAAMQALKAQGWEVYADANPLAGQRGFRCVEDDGSHKPPERRFLWNIFGSELIPITIDCLSPLSLYAFALEHGTHEGFNFFEYPNGDFGFACYCQGATRGTSLVLQIPKDLELDDAASDFLWQYQKDLPL